MSSSSPDLSAIALAVFAGGEGSRMGRPKVELTLGGKPILHALLDGVAWPGPTILCVAASHTLPPGSERFTRIVPDTQPAQGPLRGLAAALAHASACGCDAVVAIPVDMPLLCLDHLAWLASELRARPQVHGLMLVRTTPAGVVQVEPFPCAFRTSFAPVVERRLGEDRRSLRGLTAEPAVETVSPPAHWPEQTWTNLNTPADLEAFENRLRSGGE